MKPTCRQYSRCRNAGTQQACTYSDGSRCASSDLVTELPNHPARKLASAYVLIAQLGALKTRREGMLADNADRTLRGVPLNYYEDSFSELEREFEALANKFKETKNEKDL